MKTVLQKLCAGDDLKIPTLPAVGLELLRAFKDDDFSIRDLADTISLDPALSARTLSMANSALYCLPYKVTNVEKAVSMLGSNTIKNLAFSFVVIGGFKTFALDNFNMDLFWKKSIIAAVAAETIANRLRKEQKSSFIVALLMDIGRLVMHRCKSEEYQEIMKDEEEGTFDRIALERDVFDFDHQEVGGEILKKWGLPDTIYMPVRCHHMTKACPPNFRDIVMIIELSHLISIAVLDPKNPNKVVLKSLKRKFEDLFGYNVGEIKAALEDIQTKSGDVLNTVNL